MRHAFFALEIATDQNVEELVSPSQFDVRFDHDRVPALHDRILDFMGMNGLLPIDSLTKIFALEHLLQGDAAVEPDHFFVSHLAEPIPIEDDLGAAGIEDLESLLAIGLGVGLHFGGGEMRSGGGAAARIPDQPGEIANDEDGLMSQILELT